MRILAGVGAVALVLCAGIMGAQSVFDSSYFQPPLAIPLYLSGNFGELRSNHFHTGIDIKTQGREGLPVLASAGGHVSRVRISPFGYGRALYIDHPNGLTTVYGHLLKFSPELEAWCMGEMHRREIHVLDTLLPAGKFAVAQGQQIALSGNTGGSGGPHLHFEIRTTETEKPLNGLLFGLPIADNIPPEIRSLRLYPLTNESGINTSGAPEMITVKRINGRYTSQPEVVRVIGTLGIGVQTIDKLNGQPNICGPRTIGLFRNDSPWFEYRVDSLNFDESRYINAHKDYELYHRQGLNVHRLFVQPGNGLGNYQSWGPSADGSLEVSAGDTVQLRIRVTDAHGNFSDCELTLVGDETQRPRYAERRPRLSQDADYLLRTEGARVLLPRGALYAPADSLFETRRTCKQCVSAVVEVLGDYVPLHRPATLQIWPDNGWSSRTDLVGVRFDNRNSPRYAGGVLEERWLAMELTRGGRYAVMPDSLPPSIAPAQAVVRFAAEARFTVRDDLSGVGTYRATLNDQWLWVDYDPKKSLMVVRPSLSTLPKQAGTLRLEVTDRSGNTSWKEISIQL